MENVIRVSRKELTTDEILEVLDDGGRVLIEISIIGQTMKVVIREQEGKYYCDTPVKLLVHDNQDDLRECLVRYRLAKNDRAEPDSAPTTAESGS